MASQTNENETLSPTEKAQTSDTHPDNTENVASQSPASNNGRGNRKGNPKGGNNRGRSSNRSQDRNQRGSASELIDKVVHINRTTKVVKGGRRFGFSALVVVGDRKGKVGIGFGKANEVANAVKKATESASKRLHEVVLKDGTIPHAIEAHFDGGYVLLRPASPGTGIIAGAGVRAVVEAAGVRDVLAKSLGSANPFNVVNATLNALKQLRSAQEIFSLRGKKWRETIASETATEAQAAPQ
jgi:small subunit ribosomal protein S5